MEAIVDGLTGGIQLMFFAAFLCVIVPLVLKYLYDVYRGEKDFSWLVNYMHSRKKKDK
jgi:hypothetical protein